MNKTEKQTKIKQWSRLKKYKAGSLKDQYSLLKFIVTINLNKKKSKHIQRR